MDPLRIAVRAAFAFVFLLAVMRIAGTRTIGQADLSSFIVAIVIGDLFDDFFWAEVSAAEFVVAIGTIVTVHLAAMTAVTASSRRGWLRRAREGA
jgi:uncharacterized membrane protein YcaP (DUF421 family)